MGLWYNWKAKKAKTKQKMKKQRAENKYKVKGLTLEEKEMMRAPKPVRSQKDKPAKIDKKNQSRQVQQTPGQCKTRVIVKELAKEEKGELKIDFKLVPIRGTKKTQIVIKQKTKKEQKEQKQKKTKTLPTTKSHEMVGREKKVKPGRVNLAKKAALHAFNGEETKIKTAAKKKTLQKEEQQKIKAKEELLALMKELREEKIMLLQSVNEDIKPREKEYDPKTDRTMPKKGEIQTANRAVRRIERFKTETTKREENFRPLVGRKVRKQRRTQIVMSKPKKTLVGEYESFSFRTENSQIKNRYRINKDAHPVKYILHDVAIVGTGKKRKKQIKITNAKKRRNSPIKMILHSVAIANAA